MDYAPIIIPTLCRYDHLRKCLDSLSRCKDADKTEVYIGIDYPTKDVHWEGYKKICLYLEEYKFPFKRLVVDKRIENCGPSKNIQLLTKDYIIDRFETYIFTEDDNEFSPNFLRFINTNLEKYKTDENVYAVCGYNYPFDFTSFPQDRIYKSFFYSPWGVGLWVNKNKKAVSVKEVDDILRNIRKVISIGAKIPFLLHTLISMRYDNVLYGDAVLRARLFLDGKKCIFPILSKVRNMGFDKSGLNCKDDGGIHINQNIDIQTDYYHNEEIDVPNFFKMVNEYYRRSVSDRIKICMKYLLYIFGVGKSKK